MHILHQIPSRCTLRRVLKHAIFKSGRPRCPHCNYATVRPIKQEERWRCKRCFRPFSLKSCCWLKGSKLSLEAIWLLLWCWQKEIPVKQTAWIVGVSVPTVFHWFTRFRRHVPSERLAVLLSGKVAADEMFTTGNCIIGAKQKGTRNLALKTLHKSDPDKRDAVEFLLKNVSADSELHTDGSGIYRGIDNWHRLKHTYEVHSKWEFSLTAEIEGIWGVFRTFVRRMYHHVTKYRLHELVAEFTLRFRRDEVFNSPEDYWRICLGAKPFAL